MADMLRLANRVVAGKLRSVVVLPNLNPQPDGNLAARLLTTDVWFYNEDGSFHESRSYGTDQKDLVGLRITNWVLYGSLQ